MPLISSVFHPDVYKRQLYNEKDIIISTPHTDKLENLHKQFPAIRIMTENQYAISEADIIIPVSYTHLDVYKRQI